MAEDADRTALRLRRQIARQIDRAARQLDRQAGRARKPAGAGPNVLIVAQAGPLAAQAALLVASIRQNAPGWTGRLIVAEPQPEGAWAGHDTSIPDPARAALLGLGAEIAPFTARLFGAAYPQGNKIEALALLPPGAPFLFLDSDSIVTGPLDTLADALARPTASMRREGTWPVPPPYGPGYAAIWGSLYARFGVEMAPTLDLTQPEEHWERHLYFNASWFGGPDPAPFAERCRAWAQAVWADPGEALASQALTPWLDQIVLPLVVASLGGGRPEGAAVGLDDARLGWHYRRLGLLYAAAPDRAVAAVERAAAHPALAAVIADWPAAAALVSAGRGRDVIRPAFDRTRLPVREQALRKRLRALDAWSR